MQVGSRAGIDEPENGKGLAFFDPSGGQSLFGF
jgi:hypothetical protein